MKSEVLVDYTLQLWNERDFDVMKEMYLPNVYVHMPDFPEPMYYDEHKDWIEMQFEAYSDLHVELHEMTVGEFVIFLRWTMTGRQDGALGRIPPSGREIVLDGTTVYRLEEDKIAEAWWYYDRLAVMQQLGVQVEMVHPEPV